ncbi:MAG TPA: hypothetical protein VIL74_15695 [Pyrinomonadaceae bacterium]|jgi:hypothetical protein
MARLVLSFFILAAFSFSVFAQENDSSGIKTIEFVSPILPDGKFDPNPVRRNCFSFITETADCRKVSDLYYGNLRSGSDWDWFQVMGIGSRNKIKKLGSKNWTDDFKIPVVEPYAKLKEGERRTIVLDASGKDGEDGKPGINGDGSITYDSGVYEREMPPVGSFGSKKTPKTNYHPYEKAVRGNMYVMRVVDEKNDFYVLFRVDELERGMRCKISWKRIAAPQEN